MTSEVFYDTRLTLGAEQDLEFIHDYANVYRSPAQAAALLETLMDPISTLQKLPERGAIPMELADLSVREYQQLVVSRCRIIHRVKVSTVYIFVIADGRRDMWSLFERRLLST